MSSFTQNLTRAHYALAGVILAVLLVFVGYQQLNGVHQARADYENGLNAQYVSNQNELSSYISGFYEQLGVAKLKSQKLNDILLAAVKGRYDAKGSAAQVGKGQLFSAISEAYPELTGLNVYDKV